MTDLPGILKEHVELTVEGPFLRIVAWRKEEHDENMWKSHHTELNSGKVERRFRLPDDVDMSRMTAIFERGVLDISMPKKTPDHGEPHTHTIKIN